MPTVQANGFDIYFEVHGQGEPLLLIAGFACDHTIWSLVVADLARHYRVVVFDNRGTGQSSGAAISGIGELAEDAAGLLAALGLDGAHVAGHSMGGMIAQELALLQPQRVRTLSLIASCARVDARGRAIIEAWGQMPRLVEPAFAARLVLPWMYTNAFFARPGAAEDAVAQIVACQFPPSAEAIFRQSQAISAFDSSDRLINMDCPTLVLVGHDDILFPIPFAEKLAHGIRGAELVVVENTGHGLLIETPVPVAGAMLDFLQRKGVPTGSS